MSNDRLSLKLRAEVAERFRRFARPEESRSETVARLLDAAGVPERLHCSTCGTSVQAHARDEQGHVLCLDCAGVEPEAALFGGESND